MNDEILIKKAIDIMNLINDPEHNMMHIKDVIYYANLLKQKIKCNERALLIACYWHDVGRIKSNIGHEEISGKMLSLEMKKLNYDDNLINECYLAIINHKWNMQPTTITGLVLKDADKLSFIGKNRWNESIKNNKDLREIKKLLPKLRNEILYFDESKKIFDNEIEKFKKKYKVEF